MLGVRTAASKTSPTVAKTTNLRSVPTLLPKERRPDKRVFLPEELWTKLSAAAKFHEETFKKMGHEQSVSRNDIIENFLEWALDTYWQAKGGEPSSKGADREAKIAAFAAQMEKEEAARAKDKLEADDALGR